MEVSYHGPTRAPAKALNGTTRIAAWLGGGKIAVSGVDYASSGTGSELKVSTTPFGLQLLDTSSWTYRTLDTAAAGLVADGARVIGRAPTRSSAYDAAGTHLYDIPAPSETWVTPALRSEERRVGKECGPRWVA